MGRVDAFIQSTDKNLLVPVGGAIVASCNEPFLQAVAQTYPGEKRYRGWGKIVSMTAGVEHITNFKLFCIC